MQNKWVINVLLIVIMFLVVVACGVTYMCLTNDVEIVEQKKEETLFSKENYPKIDGEKATLLLAEAFKANFTGTDISEIEVKHSTTHNSYVNLINGNADLILVTYPSEDELKMAENKNIELEIVPIAKDAFVFFVNKENTIESLDLSQIRDIYCGKIKNWKDIGGVDNEIIAYQRPANSESQNGILKLVMQGNKMMKAPNQTVLRNLEEEIIDVISDYDNKENAIGYSYYNYAKTMYTTNKMKFLSINGIEPTYENIQTGLYDMQTTYYAVIRKDELENSDTRKLLNAMKSEEGQVIAKEAGYVQNY